MDLARELQEIEPRISTSPWSDYEHYRGYAVMSLPFSSGHQLGLRVFPENDFAPYTSVWHRTPEGEWSIYNDGPSLETTCPRLWGPALQHTGLKPIELTWTGPNELRVGMEEPRLVWKMAMTAPPLLRILNTVNTALPLWTWRPIPLQRLREWLAKRLLGMGDLRFSFVSPAGHEAVAIFERVYFIDSSEAVWEGRDLGSPIRLDANPTIGGVALPTRPTFATAQAHARIKDCEEYERTRQQIRAGVLNRNATQSS